MTDPTARSPEAPERAEMKITMTIRGAWEPRNTMFHRLWETGVKNRVPLGVEIEMLVHNPDADELDSPPSMQEIRLAMTELEIAAVHEIEEDNRPEPEGSHGQWERSKKRLEEARADLLSLISRRLQATPSERSTRKDVMKEAIERVYSIGYRNGVQCKCSSLGCEHAKEGAVARQRLLDLYKEEPRFTEEHAEAIEQTVSCFSEHSYWSDWGKKTLESMAKTIRESSLTATTKEPTNG